MAPGTEVKPPRIRTGRAFSAMSERLNCTPLLAPHMTPATMATRPATETVDLHAAHDERRVGNADVELLDVGPPRHLTEALEEEVEPDGGHEQDDVLLVHQRPQHDALDGEGQRDHDDDGKEERHGDGRYDDCPYFGTNP